jgi:hypothetical protein
VRVEDVGVLSTEQFFGSPFDGGELSSREPHRRAEATHLTLHAVLVEQRAIDTLARARVDAQHAPDRRAL